MEQRNRSLGQQHQTRQAMLRRLVGPNTLLALLNVRHTVLIQSLQYRRDPPEPESGEFGIALDDFLAWREHFGGFPCAVSEPLGDAVLLLEVACRCVLPPGGGSGSPSRR